MFGKLTKLPVIKYQIFAKYVGLTINYSNLSPQLTTRISTRTTSMLSIQPQVFIQHGLITKVTPQYGGLKPTLPYQKQHNNSSRNILKKFQSRVETIKYKQTSNTSKISFKTSKKIIKFIGNNSTLSTSYKRKRILGQHSTSKNAASDGLRRTCGSKLDSKIKCNKAGSCDKRLRNSEDITCKSEKAAQPKPICPQKDDTCKKNSENVQSTCEKGHNECNIEVSNCNKVQCKQEGSHENSDSCQQRRGDPCKKQEICKEEKCKKKKVDPCKVKRGDPCKKAKPWCPS